MTSQSMLIEQARQTSTPTAQQSQRCSHVGHGLGKGERIRRAGARDGRTRKEIDLRISAAVDRM